MSGGLAVIKEFSWKLDLIDDSVIGLMTELMMFQPRTEECSGWNNFLYQSMELESLSHMTTEDW